jgi:hypothetical protein
VGSKYIVDVKKDQMEFDFLDVIRRDSHAHRAIRKKMKNRLSQQDCDEIFGRQKNKWDDSKGEDW